MRARQKNNFDQHHRAKILEPLLPGETVWLPDCSSSGKVVKQTASRSFVVQTSEGVCRRNCWDIVSMHVPDPEDSGEAGSQPATDSNTTQTRSGRMSKPLDRFDPGRLNFMN